MRGDIRPQLNVCFEANFMLDGINIDQKCINRHKRKICQEITTPSAKLLWNSKFIGINWNSVWTSSSRYCVTNKIKEVSFKIIHSIYAVNQAISRYKDVNVNCTFCEQEEENICHHFFECCHTYLFWKELKYMFVSLTGIKLKLKKKTSFSLMMEKNLMERNSFCWIFL